MLIGWTIALYGVYRRDPKGKLSPVARANHFYDRPADLSADSRQSCQALKSIRMKDLT